MATKKTPKAAPKKKTAANKAGAKKAVAKTAAAKPASTIEAELDPSLEWSLDEVEPYLKPVSEEQIARVRAAIVRAMSEDELVALGSTQRSEVIIGAAPPFTIGTLLALELHGSTPLGLAPALPTLLVREARNLANLDRKYEQEHRDVSTTISGRREGLKVANSKALSRRRSVAQTLLRYVVPASDAVRRAQLEAASAGAKTPSATIASTRSVARVLAELRTDETLRPVLDDYGYTDAVVTELNELAADVKRRADQAASVRPPQKASQRALDMQDGLVLAIMRAIWDALREARADGAAFALPPARGLERHFSIATSTAQDSVEEEEEEVDPATDDGDVDDETTVV
jgi:hypothetical protein